MSNTFKIFIAVFLAIIAANFFNSAMFRLWYPSDTQLAVQQSQKYIDDYNKMQAERVESTLKYHEQVRSEYLDNSIKQNFGSSNQNRNIFSNSNNNNATNISYIDNSKYAQQVKQLEKENKERKNAQNERKRLRDIENETRRKKHENKMADLEHIRSENMKTCNFWKAEYQRNPIAQNEMHKKTVSVG